MGSRVERESKKRRRLPLRSVSDPGHDGKSHWYRWLSLGVSIRFGVLVLAKELRLQRDEGEKEVEFADSSHRRWKVRCWSGRTREGSVQASVFPVWVHFM
uniref:uncharacterized protein LOC101294419 isoform X2 n=1 Tax=Fragaria vesca subsp. vesca TaxID=101020 RepID=UPI0005C8949B|nr:PREDICTED: uncharacterized protein LOC101294419 isoform X2 [Fragaria vesca subsp. vesca]